ncbi:MAG: hypothetical protein ACREDR_22875, partial [Blastocatellia bacterium]
AFKVSLRETWKEGIPANINHITTPRSLLNDTRLFASSNGQFYVLDTSTGKTVFSRAAPGFYFLEPSPDGKKLLAAELTWKEAAPNDLWIHMLDATPGSNYPSLYRKPALTFGAAFSPDGSKVYFTGGGPARATKDISDVEVAAPAPGDTISGVFCASTSDLSTVFTVKAGGLPAGISISPDGKTLCVVEMLLPRLYLIDIATKKVTTIPIGDFSGARTVNSVWSPDGTKVYATNRTPGTIWVVKVATKEVSEISLGHDVAPARLRLGPTIPDFDDGSNILYALYAPDGTVAAISTVTDKVVSRVSLGQGSNPAFSFEVDTRDTFRLWACMAIAPDGKSIYVNDPIPGGNSIFVIGNGWRQNAEIAQEGLALEGTVFDLHLVAGYGLHHSRPSQSQHRASRYRCDKQYWKRRRVRLDQLHSDCGRRTRRTHGVARIDIGVIEPAR